MENNDRAYAHYKRAKMYTKYGDIKKANAHMGRAMHYYRRGGSTRFGNGGDWKLDPGGDWKLSFVASNERNEDFLAFTFVRGNEIKTMITRGLADNYTGKLQYIIKGPNEKPYSPQDAKAYLPSFLDAILADRGNLEKLIKQGTGSSYVHHGDPNTRKRYSNLAYSFTKVVTKLLEWRKLQHAGADYDILD